MSNIIQIIEEMCARLSKATESEKALVRALADALSGGDERLLQDVRNITKEHEVRRGALMYELENLASRIGAFPMVEREAVAGIEYAQAGAKPFDASDQSVAGADWRKAANNVDDELDLLFSSHTSSR